MYLLYNLFTVLVNFQSERPRKEVDYTMSDTIYDDSDHDVGNSRSEHLEGRAASADLLAAGDSMTSPSKVNRNEIVDQEPSGECLGRGSSFYQDKSALETTVIGSNWSKNEDIHSGDQLPNDYLTMGGGFCLDDDDTNPDPGGLASPTKAATSDSDLPSPSSFADNRNSTSKSNQPINRPNGTMDILQQEENSSLVDTSHAKNNTNDTKENSESSLLQKIPPDDGDHALNDSGRYLRAMPNLRRKRRKS